MHSHWRGAKEWKDQGLDLSTGSDQACHMYDAIVTQYCGWYDDPGVGGMEATLERMKAADPEFVMGHVVDCGLELLGTGSNTQADAQLRGRVATMADLAQGGKLTWREDKHVEALKLWAQGDTPAACLVWEDILTSHPTDTLALKFAHDTYFYLGHSFQMRDSVARVLPYWNSGIPLYGYIHGMHSFGLEETNLYTQAEASARKALSINPRDAWATHTLCHVMEMTGRQDEGIRMMQSTEKFWQSCGMLACHNAWHLALYHVELGEYENALSVFDQQVSVRASASGAMLDIVDVCSLLYRLELEGVNIGDRWDAAFDFCKNHLKDHVLAFNDLHILMSCLGAHRQQAADELMASIRHFVQSGSGHNKQVTASVGQQLMAAFVSFSAGDHAGAVEAVWPVRYKVIDIGGSHAQRDLVNLFLIQACIRSPLPAHHKRAKALLNERKLWKPHAPMTDRLMARADSLFD